VPVGSVTVSAARIGYATRTERVTLAGGESRTLDFALTTATTELRAVRDRNFNHGGLRIVLSPLPRKHRCAGDGPSATVTVSLAGPWAWGPVDDSGPAGPSVTPRWDVWSYQSLPHPR